MALSKTLSDYEDIRPKLDHALTTEKGIRVLLPDHGKAVHMRQRCYALRKLEKRASQDIFEIGDERRGTSAYDNLEFAVVDCAVEIRKVASMIVEEL